MFSGLWFVLKTFAFTVLVLILLQMKFGDKTLEERTTVWVQQSNLVAPLEKFAVQAGRWAKKEWEKVDLKKIWDGALGEVKDLYESTKATESRNSKPAKESPQNSPARPTQEDDLKPLHRSFQWG